MFGPNTVFSNTIKMTFSHRDTQFFQLFEETRIKFQEKFALQNYDILFIPGSASVGMEAIISSCASRIAVTGCPGKFRDRWSNIVNHYRGDDSEGEELLLYCLLETSRSQYNEIDTDIPCIVDAISAFPYYPIPDNASIFCTCLNKIVGSYIGVAVVGVRKDSWHLIKRREDESYLNLWRYYKYAQDHQTPSTFPIYTIQHLVSQLDVFDIDTIRTRISSRYDSIVDAIGADNVIGDKNCPVITIKRGVLPKHLCEKYHFYGYDSGRDFMQIFLYSEKQEAYDELLADLREEVFV